VKLLVAILALSLVACQTAEQRERAALRRLIEKHVGPLPPE